MGQQKCQLYVWPKPFAKLIASRIGWSLREQNKQFAKQKSSRMDQNRPDRDKIFLTGRKISHISCSTLFSFFFFFCFVKSVEKGRMPNKVWEKINWFLLQKRKVKNGGGKTKKGAWRLNFFFFFPAEIRKPTPSQPATAAGRAVLG